MNRERYVPSPDELKIAEEHLTDVQKREMEEREKAFARSKPGVLNEKIGTLLHRFEGQLLHLDRVDEMARTNGYHRKPEFHFTLINNRAGKVVKQALEVLSKDQRQKAIDAINTAASETDWSASPGEIYEVEKDYVATDDKGGETSREHRASLIQKLDIPGMQTFYQRLNSILNIQIEPPPAHITLYSKSSDPKNHTRGIGIETQKEMEEVHPRLVSFEK